MCLLVGGRVGACDDDGAAGAPLVGERGSCVSVEISVGSLVKGDVVAVGIGAGGVGDGVGDGASKRGAMVVRDQYGGRGPGRDTLGWKGIIRPGGGPGMGEGGGIVVIAVHSVSGSYDQLPKMEP